MVINKKAIIKILCAVMALVGLSMLLPLLVSLYYREFSVAKCFAVCAFPVIVLGGLGIKFLPKQDNSILRMRDGFFIVAATWLVMSLLGCIPFVISGAIPRFADAFFETVSGFTTTGSSILSEIQSLPKGILFWRSFTHWLGGMGVLVLTIALLPMLGIGGQKIMRAETTGPTMDKISFTINSGARGLYIVYGAMTVIEIVLLMLCGLDAFDASTHAFGTMGTGGFSTYNASIGAFNNLPAEIIITVFMVLAGVNFNLYYSAVAGKTLSPFKDPEFRTYIAIVLAAMAFITAVLTINKTYGSFGSSLRNASFTVGSIISSTGYAITDFEVWPEVCKLTVLILMFIGGCGGSTAGGLKVIRCIVLMKLIKRNVKKRLSPRTVSAIKVGGKEVSEDTLNGIVAHIGLYAILCVAGTFIISLTGVDNITSFTSIVTCLSNIGPGFGMIGPTENFGFYSDFIKYLLSVYMIAGRLEMFTIVILFTRDFWDKNR